MPNESVLKGQRSPITLREIAQVLFKYKNKMLLLFLVSIVGAVGYLLYVDPSYEAEVKILVLLGPEKFSAMEAYQTDQISVIFQERGENIANEMEIIQDKAIAYRVLERFKEAKALAELEEVSLWKRFNRWRKKATRWVKETIKWPLYAVGLATRLTDDELMLLELQGSFHVEFLEVTDIIRATFRYNDPEVAAFLLNAYVEEYLAHRMAVLGNNNSKGFYEDQIQLYKEKLSTIEEKLNDFREGVDISSIELQRDLILHEISKVESLHSDKLRELEQINLTASVVEAAYKKDDQWIETPVLDNALPDYEALDERYMELFAEKNELLDAYTPDSREVRSLDAQMKQLRDEKVRNLLRSLENRRNLMEQIVNSYEMELSKRQAELRNLDTNEKDLNELTREKDLIEKAYLTYSQRAEELRITSDMTDRQIASVRVISPAVPPPVPAGPKKKLILALAAFLGLVLGLAYAAIAQFFSHTFETARDVEGVLEIPLLATFSFTSPGS